MIAPFTDAETLIVTFILTRMVNVLVSWCACRNAKFEGDNAYKPSESDKYTITSRDKK